MGTTDPDFYLTSTVWDGTQPSGGDVRKLLSSATAPANQSGGSVDLGTSGSKQITVDPFTAGRTTTGAFPEFGWAINVSGSDGMDGAADAKRFVPAGVWAFQGSLRASPATAANAVTVDAGIYRVAAAPSTTRTLLFTATSAGVFPTAAGVSWSASSASQPQYTLEAGETLQAMYVITGTGQVGGLTIDFRIGDEELTLDARVDLPGGVRTQYQETISTVCVGVATVTDGTKTVTGTVRDSVGTPVAGATAKLFDQDTDTRISTYTTGGDGTYTFTRADTDTATYWVVGFSDATHHGTSDRGLTAT